MKPAEPSVVLPPILREEPRHRPARRAKNRAHCPAPGVGAAGRSEASFMNLAGEPIQAPNWPLHPAGWLLPDRTP